jgi:hypothetical protein
MNSVGYSPANHCLVSWNRICTDKLTVAEVHQTVIHLISRNLDESNQKSILFHFNSILPSNSRSSKITLLSGFPTKKFFKLLLCLSNSFFFNFTTSNNRWNTTHKAPCYVIFYTFLSPPVSCIQEPP